MSDLISREKLKDDIAVLLERNDKLIDEWLANCIDDVIDEQPTVDAEPVVRCKDCKYYRYYDGTFGKGWMCFENNTARHGDDYCSRGEREDVLDTNVGKMHQTCI